MVDIPTLSREYVSVALTELDFNPAELNLHRVAFTAAGVPPEDADWVDAILEGATLKILVGPERGDAVTTQDLAGGLHQMWVEVSTAASDERVVRVAGIVNITTPTAS